MALSASRVVLDDPHFQELQDAGQETGQLRVRLPTASDVTEVLTRWKREQISRKDLIEFVARFRDARYLIAAPVQLNLLKLFVESARNVLRSVKHVEDLLKQMIKGKLQLQGKLGMLVVANNGLFEVLWKHHTTKAAQKLATTHPQACKNLDLTHSPSCR
eukprot:g2072.t1